MIYKETPYTMARKQWAEQWLQATPPSSLQLVRSIDHGSAASHIWACPMPDSLWPPRVGPSEPQDQDLYPQMRIWHPQDPTDITHAMIAYDWDNYEDIDLTSEQLSAILATVE